MSFGENLKNARTRAGCTLAALSEKSGIQMVSILKMESGQIARPQLQEVMRLARALGVRRDELAVYDEPKNTSRYSLEDARGIAQLCIENPTAFQMAHRAIKEAKKSLDKQPGKQ